MKALSIRQPYADQILEGKKTIELRSWNTKHRGPFLIHSQGFIIGKADLVSVKEYKFETLIDFIKDRYKHQCHDLSKAQKYKYGFVLKNAKRIHPRSYKGQLGFFNVDHGVVVNDRTYF